MATCSFVGGNCSISSSTEKETKYLLAESLLTVTVVGTPVKRRCHLIFKGDLILAKVSFSPSHLKAYALPISLQMKMIRRM